MAHYRVLAGTIKFKYDENGAVCTNRAIYGIYAVKGSRGNSHLRHCARKLKGKFPREPALRHWSWQIVTNVPARPSSMQLNLKIKWLVPAPPDRTPHKKGPSSDDEGPLSLQS